MPETRLWSLCLLRLASPALLLVLLCAPTSAEPRDPDRLHHQGAIAEPFAPDRQRARLTTPQWIGRPGVEAAIVVSIDDLDASEPHARFLAPILEQLETTTGRGAVSLLANRPDPTDPGLPPLLSRGVSIGGHSETHACPLLQAGSLARAQRDVHANLLRLFSIPGNRPIVFRTPCADSQNTPSPRVYAEVLAGLSPRGQFFRASSSVAHVFTAADPALPWAVATRADGTPRFARHLAPGHEMYIEDYPYPYVVGHTLWELPFSIPSDYLGSETFGPASPQTVVDLRAVVDATVAKAGLGILVLHPYDWIRAEQVREVIAYAHERYGERIAFLTLPEVVEHLETHALGGRPLRTPGGRDAGARILDLDADGYMDAVVGHGEVRQTRVWDPARRRWLTSELPVSLALRNRDAGAKFLSLPACSESDEPPHPTSLLVRNGSAAGLWHFDGRAWHEVPGGLEGLVFDDQPIETSAGGRDTGVRVRDLDGDGASELVVAGTTASGVFAWRPCKGHWTRVFDLPPGVRAVDRLGRDAGLRFVDLDADGDQDLVYSDAERWAVHLFEGPDEGFGTAIRSGTRKDAKEERDTVPAIARADGSSNGAWFARGQMRVQNEDTGARHPYYLDTRSYRWLQTPPGRPEPQAGS